MNMDKLLARKTVGQRLRYLREEKELNQKDLEQKTRINRKKLGRLESDKQELTHSDAIILADFYNISCDTLLRGVRTECYHIEYITGLKNGAIKYLYKIKRNHPEIMEIINDILGNKEIAEPLFEAFYIYAMLDLPPFVKLEDGTPVGRITLALSDEQTILKNVVSDYLHEILISIRSKYEGKKHKQNEKEVELMLEKFRSTMREKEEQNLIHEKELLKQQLLEETLIKQELLEQDVD